MYNFTEYIDNILGLRNQSKKIVLLIALLAIALLIRIYGLGDHSIWLDEAGTASLVETYLGSGNPKYPSGVESERSMPFIIATAASVYLFSLDSFALRLPSVIFAVLTIVVTYFWSESLFEGNMVLVAPAILSFSSWHVAMSQNARMYMMFQFLYLCTFFLVYKYLCTNRKILIISAAVFASLSALTHVTAYVLPLTIPLVLYISSEEKPRSAYIFGFIIAISTAFIAQGYYFEFSDVLSRFTPNIVSSYSHLTWLIFNIPLVTVAGAYGLVKSFNQNRNLFYVCSLGVIPPSLVYYFLVELPASRYLFFTLTFLALLSSYGLNIMLKRHCISGKKAYAVVVVFIVVSIGVSGNPMSHELGSHSPQPDFKSAYNSISPQVSEDDTLIAGRPLVASYYLENPDYVLWETHLDKGSKSYVNGTDLYTGSTFINNKDDLEQVITGNSSGWIVATENVQKGMPQQMSTQIKSLELVEKSKDIRVWRFSNKK